MRQVIALHPHPEPPCLDAFLDPFVEELRAFGPLERLRGESCEDYKQRTLGRSSSSKLIVDKVSYKTTPDGEIDKTRLDISKKEVTIFLGPITSDTPMRARAAKRGQTAHTFGAMCCRLQVTAMQPPIFIFITYITYRYIASI